VGGADYNSGPSPKRVILATNKGREKRVPENHWATRSWREKKEELCVKKGDLDLRLSIPLWQKRREEGYRKKVKKV